MSERPAHPEDPRLEAYLDGQLDDAERPAFERDAADRSELLRAIDLQSRIDAALARLYEPPDVQRVAAELARSNGRKSASSTAADGVADAGAPSPHAPASAPARSPKPFCSRVVMWRLAAMIILAVVGVVAIRLWLAPPPLATDPYPISETPRPMTEVYHAEVASGFEPQWVCETDEEFAGWYRKQVGRPLTLAALPPHVRAAGLSIDNVLSRRTIYLLAEVEGKPVIVFADHVANDDTPRVLSGSNLHLFRRQIGDVVLYELTPLDRPRVLEHFRPYPRDNP